MLVSFGRHGGRHGDGVDSLICVDLNNLFWFSEWCGSLLRNGGIDASKNLSTSWIVFAVHDSHIWLHDEGHE